MVGMKDGSPTIVVSLLPARSAEPPQSSGSTGASALSTLPDAVLVAIGPSPGEKPGNTSAHPGGIARAASRSSNARPDGLASAQLAKDSSHCALASPGDRIVLYREVHGRVETQDLLGGRDLGGAKGRAVCLAGVLLVRRRPADDRRQRDDRRRIGVFPGSNQGTVQSFDVLVIALGSTPAHPLGVPAICGVPGQNVF